MKKDKNITKYNRFQLNIGFILFLFIIIYAILSFVSYITKDTVSEYEVTQGTIATNHIYRSLAIREEEVVTATSSGQLSFYAKSGSKVSVTDLICSIDSNGSIASQITESVETGSLSEDEITSISDEIYTYMKSYSSTSFQAVGEFKSSLTSEITNYLGTQALVSIQDEISSAENAGSFLSVTASYPGIVSYIYDGYEDLTADTYTADAFSTASYTKHYTDQTEEVTTGQALYRIVTSEEWHVIVPITEALAETLEESGYMTIRFCKDDYSITPAYEMTKKSGAYYLDFTLNRAMIRYINDRYLDVELVINDQSGLKIPISSITEKEFFTVPKEYFTVADSTDDMQLMVLDTENDNQVTLVNPTIYYETDDYYYIDLETVSSGDIVRKQDSLETYVIGTDIDSLQGVYNINKGYAVFKQIHILASNDDYAIVENKMKYGLSLYDHIALEGDKIEENQTISK